ncbi:hypothetical protein, conserved [Eimeria acervulina]|uniref:Uncharacterized protein n=1 Tax=Eimeria acervulina TaxID=5801 RepID=U6GCD6_EIMAC|nr:hypothetical protein, conserved [Eimeria acervulina]CDI77931.1 hypothetical protein, conserved [Eimeria acervulina]
MQGVQGASSFLNSDEGADTDGGHRQADKSLIAFAAAERAEDGLVSYMGSSPAGTAAAAAGAAAAGVSSPEAESAASGASGAAGATPTTTSAAAAAATDGMNWRQIRRGKRQKSLQRSLLFTPAAGGGGGAAAAAADIGGSPAASAAFPLGYHGLGGGWKRGVGVGGSSSNSNSREGAYGFIACGDQQQSAKTRRAAIARSLLLAFLSAFVVIWVAKQIHMFRFTSSNLTALQHDYKQLHEELQKLSHPSAAAGTTAAAAADGGDAQLLDEWSSAQRRIEGLKNLIAAAREGLAAAGAAARPGAADEGEDEEEGAQQLPPMTEEAAATEISKLEIELVQLKQQRTNLEAVVKLKARVKHEEATVATQTSNGISCPDACSNSSSSNSSSSSSSGESSSSITNSTSSSSSSGGSSGSGVDLLAVYLQLLLLGKVFDGLGRKEEAAKARELKERMKRNIQLLQETCAAASWSDASVLLLLERDKLYEETTAAKQQLEKALSTSPSKLNKVVSAASHSVSGSKRAMKKVGALLRWGLGRGASKGAAAAESEETAAAAAEAAAAIAATAAAREEKRQREREAEAKEIEALEAEIAAANSFLVLEQPRLVRLQQLGSEEYKQWLQTKQDNAEAEIENAAFALGRIESALQSPSDPPKQRRPHSKHQQQHQQQQQLLQQQQRHHAGVSLSLLSQLNKAEEAAEGVMSLLRKDGS